MIASRAHAGSRGPIGSGPKNDPRSANGSLDPRESQSVARWLDLGLGAELAQTGLTELTERTHQEAPRAVFSDPLAIEAGLGIARRSPRARGVSRGTIRG